MSIEEVLARSAQVILALLAAYLVVLWFVSVVWTYRDIEMRSRNIVTQVFATLLAVLFPFLGIPLYLVLRPKDTLDGAFQRSLEEEYLIQDLEELPLCPSCQHFVADDFVLCPHCHTKLRDGCTSCDRLVDLRWSLCPYCGATQDGRDVAKPAEAPPARWVRPAARPAIAASSGSRVAAGGDAALPERVASATEPALTVIRGREHASGATATGGEPADLVEPKRGRFRRAATTEPAPATTGGRTSSTDRIELHADGD